MSGAPYLAPLKIVSLLKLRARDKRSSLFRCGEIATFDGWNKKSVFAIVFGGLLLLV
jgi:hypothetical protein